MYSGRDLKTNRPYKLLELKIVEENGWNGKYKKAYAKFEKKSKSSGYITVGMPKPISLLSDKALANIKKSIKNGKNPKYIVQKVTTRDRADKQGTYDVVDFNWE